MTTPTTTPTTTSASATSNRVMLHVWATNGSRTLADKVHTYYLLKGTATEAARQIDLHGRTAVEQLTAAGVIVAEEANTMFGGQDSHAAAGHGVTIRYASGRLRTVRAH